MSETLIIANLVLGSVHFIVTSMLHLRMNLECCGKPCFESDPVDTSDNAVNSNPPVQLANPSITKTQ